MKQKIQNILDRNFTRGDNAKALKELCDLFSVSKSEDSSGETVCLEHAHHKMYDEYKDEYYCEICEPDRQTDC